MIDTLSPAGIVALVGIFCAVCIIMITAIARISKWK